MTDKPLRSNLSIVEGAAPAITIAVAVAFTAGCQAHKGFAVPTEAKALALFQRDLTAAERHDAKSLCATAEESLQCQMDLAARPFPMLSDVHTAGFRVVDDARVVRVCGKANGEPFASDYPVTQEPKGRIAALNAVFWTPVEWMSKSAGATSSATVPSSTSAATVDCNG